MNFPKTSTPICTAPHISNYFGANETIIMQPLTDADLSDFESSLELTALNSAIYQNNTIQADITNTTNQPVTSSSVHNEPLPKRLKSNYEIHSITRSERNYPTFNILNNECGSISIMQKDNCNKFDITLKCSDDKCKSKIKVVPVDGIYSLNTAHKSPRIKLDLNNNDTFEITSYSITKIIEDHTCTNMENKQQKNSCNEFTKLYVKTHANLQTTPGEIYNKMFTFALDTLGSQFVIEHWPEPSRVKQYIKRARQVLRCQYPEILPNTENGSNEKSQYERSNYIFAEEFKLYEDKTVFHSVNDNELILFYYPSTMIYLTQKHNQRLQMDGTLWTIAPNVYSQVMIIVSTIELGKGKFLNVPVLYAFMDNRTEVCYDLLFSTVNKLLNKHVGQPMDSELFVVDNETAVINSLNKIIDFQSGSRNLRLCSFHTNQNIRSDFRKTLGKQLTRHGDEFNIGVNNYYIQCLKLYLLPVDVTIKLIDFLMDQAQMETFSSDKLEQTRIRDALLNCLNKVKQKFIRDKQHISWHDIILSNQGNWIDTTNNRYYLLLSTLLIQTIIFLEPRD